MIEHSGDHSLALPDRTLNPPSASDRSLPAALLSSSRPPAEPRTKPTQVFVARVPSLDGLRRDAPSCDAFDDAKQTGGYIGGRALVEKTLDRRGGERLVRDGLVHVDDVSG